MNIRKWITIPIFIIIVIIVVFIFNKYQYNKRADTKIPVLLFHDFLSTVPDENPDNFNYINTPQSFEENVKFILENGYTVISMKELNDANNGKTKFRQNLF